VSAGGKGFAYEYGGAIIDGMNMEERMTVCNMSIEGGALVGYVNPDQTTIDYLKGALTLPKMRPSIGRCAIGNRLRPTPMLSMTTW
jgi:homoaconitase/3-isopropylmalate dehydratase large subunit